ncbi:hypothetical protein E2320_022163 [Naja naja]|nr:hypothetical protein E2320_022163 [Naja naja]
MTGLPLLLLQFWLLAPTSAKKMETIDLLRHYFHYQEEYYSSGDLIIGGNFLLATITDSNIPDFQKGPWCNFTVYEFPQYVGLVQLLLYFQWNWVGLVTSEDDNGEHFISSLKPMLGEKEICLAFTERLKSEDFVNVVSRLTLFLQTWLKVEVIIMFGDTYSFITVLQSLCVYEHFRKTSLQKVWIFTSHWELSVMGSQDTL